MKFSFTDDQRLFAEGLRDLLTNELRFKVVMAAPVQNMRLSLNEEGLFAIVKPVTDAFTVRQLLYVFLLQGLGASAVCFGINFGVAVLVFRGQPPPILFEFPIPLAGNFGVIIAVEVLLNFVVSGVAFKHSMCQKESVRPAKFLQFDPFGPGETPHTSK